MRKDPKHRALINSLPCCVCRCLPPSVCAHIKMSYFEGVYVPYSERGGERLKPFDRWTVPLCAPCHDTQHSSNSRNQSERHFWEQRGINPIKLAASLWRNRDNRTACLGIVQRAAMGATI